MTSRHPKQGGEPSSTDTSTKGATLQHLEVGIPQDAIPGQHLFIRAPNGSLLRIKSPNVAAGETIIVQYRVPKNKLTRKKKNRDPNAPKRASNAYMIFCKSRRPRLKEEFPELAFGKIGAKLGEIWRDLRPDEKRPFEVQAAMDRQRYKKEMEKYPGALEQKAKHRKVVST
mmetsp:Transcript_10810/g.16095  ORF Transcript_10810/g.16095 Transcript_10810/m.16095 type:complete len:171 (-) Transcript_10810:200-712(-)